MDPWASVSCLGREEIRRLQSRKLSSFIRDCVYPFSPQYRKLFDDNNIDPKSIQSVEDLARVPFSSKSDFVGKDVSPSKFKDFVLQPDKQKIKESWPLSKKLPLAFTALIKGKKAVEDQLSREFRPVFITYTTGTTNMPMPFMYSNYDIENLRISGARMLKLFDIDPTESIINIFPFAPHLAFWQVVFGGLASNSLILSTGGGKVIGTEGNIRALSRMKPSVVLGVPTYVYHVLRLAAERGEKMDFLKKIVLGASRITIPFKKKLSEVCASMGSKDVSIFGTYGFTESRCAWAECPTAIDVSSGYHLYPDKEIFEVVDPKSGEVKGEGEDGELVYTSLDSRASSVLRYRTGDFVKGGITYEPCGHCGRSVGRISSDITRLSDVKDLNLSKIKGSLVNLNHFSSILTDEQSIHEWQLEIKKKNNDPFEVDEISVYVSKNDDNIDEAKLKDEIRKKILLSSEVSPNEIEIVSREDMIKRLELETANKEKRIVDLRPKD